MLLLEDKVRKARKKHRCAGCFGAIKTHTKYRWLKWIDQTAGQFISAKLCPKCEYVFRNLESKFDWYPDEEWCEGDLKEYHNEVPKELLYYAEGIAE